MWVTPEALTTAATDITGIGRGLDEANAAAATSITGIPAAAADEVSTAIAALFSAQGETFTALNAQAAAFQQRFGELMNENAGAYINTEVANVQQMVNGTFVADTGRPLFGDGANGYTNAQGVGTPGGAGGWLWGNGGTGGNSTAIGANGGAGGSAMFFGNGGGGGTGGPGSAGPPVIFPGGRGYGGDAGIFVGTGGTGGFNGRNGVIP